MWDFLPVNLSNVPDWSSMSNHTSTFSIFLAYLQMFYDNYFVYPSLELSLIAEEQYGTNSSSRQLTKIIFLNQDIFFFYDKIFM